MKFRVILSVILAFAVMVLSREMSLRKRAFLVIQKGDVRIEHLTVTDKIGPGDVKIEAKITTPSPSQDYAKKLFYKTEGGAYRSVDLLSEGDTVSPNYKLAAFIPAQHKGKRAYYYITVEDRDGNKISLPDRIESIDPPFLLKFKGRVPVGVILPHVLGMAAALFFTFLALFFAMDIFLNRNALNRLAISISFAAISIFVGGLVLGAMVTHHAFGGYWEGIPIGWDITDNKTLIMLLYWLILLFLMKGTLLKKDENLNLLEPNPLATFTVIGVILTLLLYLVPHSIRL